MWFLYSKSHLGWIELPQIVVIVNEKHVKTDKADIMERLQIKHRYLQGVFKMFLFPS